MTEAAGKARVVESTGRCATIGCGAAGRAAGCLALWLAMLVWPSCRVGASDAAPVENDAALRIVTTMLNNELAAAQHKDRYSYLSLERSERTGGHLWKEKVVEGSVGKVRMLLEEDGRPLSPQRIAQERGLLAAIVADPASFTKKAQTVSDDEAHARQLLTLLPQAFLFSYRDEGDYLRIDFRPNPGYQTQSIEERVLHAMVGTMLVDAKAMRLRRIEGRLPVDVSIGFGLLATIRAGSNFATTRDSLGELDWKTTLVDTDITGRAIFFKSIARKEHAEHSNFVRLSNDLTVAQAVAIAEQP